MMARKGDTPGHVAIEISNLFTNEGLSNMPDYLAFHRSLTDELHALKDRVRNLVPHWGTDGEYKEAALRAVLKRHLPESLIVGRGFIVTATTASTQIDLLIVDSSKPTLFRDGDLMFVTPDCVKAVIEVKTSLDSTTDVRDCLAKLGEIGRLCREHREPLPWLGLFCYECDLQNDTLLLDAAFDACLATDIAVNCISYGKDLFIRYLDRGEREIGDNSEATRTRRWRSYFLEHLASAYFVGNVVDSISDLSRRRRDYAWYPLRNGKQTHRLGEQRLDGEM